MLNIILTIIILISLFKPQVLLAKKVKEKTNDEQRVILANNLRKIYSIMIATLEALVIMRYNEIIGMILIVIFLVLFFAISLPAAKENSKIIKELR